MSLQETLSLTSILRSCRQVYIFYVHKSVYIHWSRKPNGWREGWPNEVIKPFYIDVEVKVTKFLFSTVSLVKKKVLVNFVTNCFSDHPWFTYESILFVIFMTFVVFRSLLWIHLTHFALERTRDTVGYLYVILGFLSQGLFSGRGNPNDIGTTYSPLLRYLKKQNVTGLCKFL